MSKPYMVHWELHGNDESRIVVAHRRKDVHALNQYIRLAKKASGELTDDIRIKTVHGERNFAVGDRIVFTQNDQSIIRNGLMGIVHQIGDTKLVVKLDDRSPPNDTVQIDHRNYKAFDHGYATSIHKSQGVTVDQSFVLSSKGMDKHLTYVAMTRHKQDAKLYRNRSVRPTLKVEQQILPRRQKRHGRENSR